MRRILILYLSTLVVLSMVTFCHGALATNYYLPHGAQEKLKYVHPDTLNSPPYIPKWEQNLTDPELTTGIIKSIWAGTGGQVPQEAGVGATDIMRYRTAWGYEEGGGHYMYEWEYNTN